MIRLTREQSQARTRERLVQTARELFVRDGYHATSLERVAEAAGYSKGAVYSNFRNKDELCLAAIDAISADEMLALGKELSGAGTAEEQLSAVTSWANRIIGDEALTTLLVEFALQGKRNPHIREQLNARGLALRETITTAFDEQGERFGFAARLPAEEMAAATLSLGLGLGMLRALDPSVSAEVLAQSLRALTTPAP